MKLSKHDMIGIALLSVAAIVVVGIVIVYHITKPPELDKVTMCPTGVPTKHTVLVIDKTDRWNGHQTDRLKNLILGIRDSIEKYEKFSIFVFEGNFENGFIPSFSLCSPGRGENVDPLWGNPRLVQQKFERAFAGPLHEILTSLTTPSTGDLSPILEVVLDLANRDEMSTLISERKFILISDMMQNSDLGSFYKQYRWRNLEKLKGLEEFAGAKFSVKYIQRKGRISVSRGALQKWEELFQDYNANVSWGNL